MRHQVRADRFFEALRTELQPQGVDVTIVSPGVVATEIRRNGWNAAGERAGSSGLSEDKAMSVEECAGLIVAAMRSRKRDEVMSPGASSGAGWKLIAPARVDRDGAGGAQQAALGAYQLFAQTRIGNGLTRSKRDKLDFCRFLALSPYRIRLSITKMTSRADASLHKRRRLCCVAATASAVLRLQSLNEHSCRRHRRPSGRTPRPEPQMSFHAFTAPRPKFIAVLSALGRLSGRARPCGTDSFR